MLGKFKFIFHICAMKETLDFFIVKVLVKSNKGGCEVTLIYFYTYLMFYILPSFHFSIILLTFGGAKIIKVYG